MEGSGGVVVPTPASEQGFFHMPKIQVPNYQKSRVFIPMSHQRPLPTDTTGAGGDPRLRQNSGQMMPNATQLSGTAVDMFDGRRIRKTMVRKTVDYNSTVVKYLENRVWQRDGRDARAIQPDALYQLEMTPPSDMQQKPMNCLTSKFMRQSTNKFRCPIFCISWTPEGRRLVTGASSGEFTLWNGLTFSFETILQAHETSVRAMVWSHNDQWMLTADHAGFIKYWQSNMNNVKMYQGHKEPIRSISFCPTDSKFATCSDDGTVRVWDFLRCYEEKILRGHGADVKCVDWHPHKSLIASGSKDNQVPIKLWDPKSGQSLATLHAHKFTVMDIKWNSNGNWLLTAARDHLMKLFDIRNLKEELQVFKGHKKEATSVAWHPINEEMFASGGSDGAIMFWNAGTEKEVGAIEEAHEAIIWDLAWHPLGHVLTSASNDHSTKFWTRNRPGDAMRDRYNLNIMAIGPDGEMLDIDADVPLGENKSLLPGMGLEFGLPPEPEKEAEPAGEELPSIPGLDWSSDCQYFKEQQAKVEERQPRKKAPYSRPIPKSFEQAWITNQQPGTLIKDVEGNMKRGKIQSLLTLDLPKNKKQQRRRGGDFDDRGPKQGNNRDSNLVEYDDKGFNPGPSDDHNPYLDGSDDDGDFRGDQDFREDQDMRGDQDFRGDMDFRSSDGGRSNYSGQKGSQRSGGQGTGGQFQEQFGSRQQGGQSQNFRGGQRRSGHQGRDGGSQMGSHGRGGGPRRGFQKDGQFGNDGGCENMDTDDNDQKFNSGPNNRKDEGSQQGQYKGQQGMKGLMDLSFDPNDKSEDYNNKDHSPSPGPRGRERGGPGDKGARGGQEGFRGRGGNNRYDDRGGRGNWNDEGSQGDSSISENNDSFNDSQGSNREYQGGNQRGGRGNFRGADNYRGGDRGGRGGRGGQRGNYRGSGGDNRGGGGRGGRGRGRGGRGGH